MYPVTGGKISQHVQVHTEDNASSLNMHYEAELDDRLTIFSLDHEESVMDVGCFDGGLHLKLEGSYTLAPGTIVVGSHRWGCTGLGLGSNNETVAVAILHEIVFIKQVPEDGATFSMIVREVSLVSMFKSLNVSYKNTLPSNVTRMSTATAPPPEPEGAVEPTGGESRRRLHFSWHSIKDKIHDDGKKLAGDAHKVGHELSDVYHGDFSEDKAHTFKIFAWSPKPNASVPVGSHVDAKGSSSYVQVGGQLKLTIEHWKLQSAQITAVVNPVMEANTHVSVPEKIHVGGSFYKELVPSTSLGSVDFAIGPIPIHATLDASLELRATVRAEDKVTFRTSAKSDRKPSTYGLEYSESAGWKEVKQTNEATTSTTVHSDVVFSANAGTDVTLTLTPTTAFNIDYLGGPKVSLGPYLNVNLTKDSKQCSQDEFSGAISWGLNVLCSAKIQLELPGKLKRLDHVLKTYPPKTVYSVVKPLLNKCFGV